MPPSNDDYEGLDLTDEEIAAMKDDEDQDQDQADPVD